VVLQRYLLLIDRISTWAGKSFAWLIVVLTVIVSYDVFMRYVMNDQTQWAFDASYMLYGVFFMMGGAYTLAQNGHVRADFVYAYFSPRVQAAIDLVLFFVFFIPGIVALAYAGVDFARISWALREHTSLSSGGPPLYHFKTFIPIAGALVLLQGVAEIVRCVICLRTGEWPRRLHDVEEIDVVDMQLKDSTLVSEEEKQRALQAARELEGKEPGHHKGGV
jgi:TRAP-type mannitol/chloroaromatic compound transport system permease small subunit